MDALALRGFEGFLTSLPMPLLGIHIPADDCLVAFKILFSEIEVTGSRPCTPPFVGPTNSVVATEKSAQLGFETRSWVMAVEYSVTLKCAGCAHKSISKEVKRSRIKVDASKQNSCR